MTVRPSRPRALGPSAVLAPALLLLASSTAAAAPLGAGADGAGADGAEPRPIAVYFADPAKAALATREGKKLQAELERAREAVEAEVKAKEPAVHALRRKVEKSGAPADRAAYEAASAELGRFIEAEEVRLEKLQDERLAPLLARLDAALAGVPKTSGVVLDASVHPPFLPPGPCDATGWLAAVVEGEPKRALPDPAPCLRRVALLADPRALGRALPESRELTARLDAFVREKQTALDGRTRELQKLPASPDAERRRLELAERYQAYADELAVRERDTEAKVAAGVRRFLGAVSASLSDAVFIERESEGEALPLPTCEVTRWLVDLLDKGAVAGAVPRGCPAYPRSEAK